MEQLNNTEQILSLLYKKYGDFNVAFEPQPGNYSKWTNVESNINNHPQHREILANELVLESDLPSEEENKELATSICKILAQNGFKFASYFSGNKSIHVHILFDEPLSKLNDSQRKNAKRLFVEQIFPKEINAKIDASNFNPKKLIRMEFSTHPKTGRTKEPYYYPIYYLENSFPKDIIEKASNFTEEKQRKVSLDYWDILKNSNPSEAERCSCIMQIQNAHKSMSDNEICDYVCLHNTWNDYNPQITSNKIKIILDKYKNLPNPLNEDKNYAIQEVEKTILENFPEYIGDVKILLSLPATLLLEDSTNPLGLIIEGPASGAKTTKLSFFYGNRHVYHSDDFTPRSFLTHSVTLNEEQRKKADLLPKFEDKFFIVPELAPTLTKRKEDLIENLGLLTRVFDGEGLKTDSGMGGRNYRGKNNDGRCLFAFCGATTPMSKTVWNTLGKLGNRWLILAVKDVDETDEEIREKMFSGKTYKQRVFECKVSINKFLDSLFLIDKYSIKWDSSKDAVFQMKMIRLARLIAKLRAEVQVWEENTGISEDDKYQYKTPIEEKPERLITLLNNLARGHAIIHNRRQLDETDWKAVLRVGLSTMPFERAKLFHSVLRKPDYLTQDDFQKILGCSQGQASKMLKQLTILGIIGPSELKESSGKQAFKLKDEFQWILSEPIQEIIETKIASTEYSKK